MVVFNHLPNSTQPPNHPPMRKTLLATALLCSMFASLAASAATIQLGTNGKLEIDIPPDWESVASGALLSSGITYTVGLRGPEALRFLAKITLVSSSSLKPSTPEQLRLQTQQIGEKDLGEAVEKAIDVKPLNVKNGHGFYYTLTDASLVGKPPQPEDYKMFGSFNIRYDNGIMVIATVFADDVNGQAFQRLLKAIPDMQPTLVAPKMARVELTKSEAGATIGNTVSRTRLFIPSASYSEEKDVRGAGGGDPGYFLGKDEKSGVVVSGWFEPSENFKYKSASEQWASEGLTKAPRAQMIKVNDWDVIAYEMSMGPITEVRNSHLRACLVTGDAWIDLHMSATGPESEVDLRNRLVAYLKAMQVTVEPEKK